MSSEHNFVFYRGEDIQLNFTQNQSDGSTPVNITGYTMTCRIASTQFGAAVITKTPTIDSGPSGTFHVNLASADTSGLTQDGADTVYYYDARRTDAGSRTELFHGLLTVKDTNTNG
jgi:hypothetical protein